MGFDQVGNVQLDNVTLLPFIPGLSSDVEGKSRLFVLSPC